MPKRYKFSNPLSVLIEEAKETLEAIGTGALEALTPVEEGQQGEALE